jgi:thiol-disulfide isomerase/thioredoxin
MNKLFKSTLVVIFLITLISCKNKTEEPEKSVKSELTDNTFTIKGNIKGLGNSKLVFRFPDQTKERKFRWDSARAKDDRFIFTEKIDKPEILYFFTTIKSIEKTAKGGGYYPVKSNQIIVYAFPGANIEVKGEIKGFVDAYPSGDPVNDDLAKLHRKIYPLIDQTGSLLVKKSFTADKKKKEKFDSLIDDLEKNISQIKQDFFKNNPGSIVSAYHLDNMVMRGQLEDEQAISLFKNLDKALENTLFYKDLRIRIDAMNATIAGNMVPEVKTTSTLDGKEFDLDSYRGKYVMIDFWGTWCAPCVGEMPKVKALLEKYGDRLYVLGVNSGDTKKRVQDFIKKEGYNWQQVLNVRGDSPDNFILKFNVTAFPTKFIISPEGKILKKFVGDSEESFKFLEKELKAMK